MSWDDAETRAFCARLVRRREVTWGLSPGGLGERLREHAETSSPGWAWDAFAARLCAARAAAAVEARFTVVEGDRTTSVPAPVREGMNSIQKPFHLWNVERIVEKSYYMLEPEQPYRVGGAAADAPEAPRGMPGSRSGSSAELARELEAEARARAEAARQVTERRSLWSQALPFGLRGEGPG